MMTTMSDPFTTPVETVPFVEGPLDGQKAPSSFPVMQLLHNPSWPSGEYQLVVEDGVAQSWTWKEPEVDDS